MNLNAVRDTIEARPAPTDAQYALAVACVLRLAPDLHDMLFAPIGGES